MSNKPTSGERIAAFMEHHRSKPLDIWLEVWFVPVKDGFEWRCSDDTSKTDMRTEPDLWQSYHVLQGKQFRVTFCSVWKVPIGLAVEIADAVVKGRTIRHELILE